MVEEILPYPCSCGGKMKKSKTQVEFFGIDFGIRECEICTRCQSEFLDDKTMAEIEQEVKKKRLFGLEKQVQVTKSGNSLVLRLPPEVVKFTGLHYKDHVRIYPIEKKRVEIEIS